MDSDRRIVAVLESAGAYSPRTLLTTISETPARHKTAIRKSWLNLGPVFLRSHRVCDEASNVIGTHEHNGNFKEW
jgi:hypothetical protein